MEDEQRTESHIRQLYMHESVDHIVHYVCMYRGGGRGGRGREGGEIMTRGRRENTRTSHQNNPPLPIHTHTHTSVMTHCILSKSTWAGAPR